MEKVNSFWPGGQKKDSFPSTHLPLFLLVSRFASFDTIFLSLLDFFPFFQLLLLSSFSVFSNTHIFVRKSGLVQSARIRYAIRQKKIQNQKISCQSLRSIHIYFPNVNYVLFHFSGRGEHNHCNREFSENTYWRSDKKYIEKLNLFYFIISNLVLELKKSCGCSLLS